MTLQWRLRTGRKVLDYARSRTGLDEAFEQATGEWPHAELIIECRPWGSDDRWARWPSKAALMLEGCGGTIQRPDLPKHPKRVKTVTKQRPTSPQRRPQRFTVDDLEQLPNERAPAGLAFEGDGRLLRDIYNQLWARTLRLAPPVEDIDWEHYRLSPYAAAKTVWDFGHTHIGRKRTAAV